MPRPPLLGAPRTRLSVVRSPLVLESLMLRPPHLGAPRLGVNVTRLPLV